MKRLSALIVAIVAMFALAGHAKAVPEYYQFDGTVSSIYKDDAGIIADAGLVVGSVVTYTLIVDFDADGTKTYNDPTLYPMYTYTDDADSDYFFTDYISGDALWQKNGGIKNAPGDVAEFNYGYNESSGWMPAGGLFVNSQDDRLHIYSDFSMVSGWAVGKVVEGWNRAYDSTGAYSQLYANLTLTSITAVPEPSTLLLLGTGVAGLAFVRRRLRG